MWNWNNPPIWVLNEVLFIRKANTLEIKRTMIIVSILRKYLVLKKMKLPKIENIKN